MIDLIATIVAIVSLVVAGGSAAYLLMMKSAAKQKGAAGAAIAADVGKRMKPVLVALAGAVVALLLTYGTVPLDILAIIVGGGSAALAGNALTAVRKDYK